MVTSHTSPNTSSRQLINYTVLCVLLTVININKWCKFLEKKQVIRQFNLRLYYFTTQSLFTDINKWCNFHGKHKFHALLIRMFGLFITATQNLSVDCDFVIQSSIPNSHAVNVKSLRVREIRFKLGRQEILYYY